MTHAPSGGAARAVSITCSSVRACSVPSSHWVMLLIRVPTIGSGHAAQQGCHEARLEANSPPPIVPKAYSPSLNPKTEHLSDDG